MTSQELLEMLTKIQDMKCENQTLEIKKALQGTPKRLYDTLSSFSNQDEGGIIIFGVDEQSDFAETGVYDAQALQKGINEQCLQMEPIVRPILTVAEKQGKLFVSAEIPGIDLAERPCYYKGQGRLKGSYRRIGDSDEPMTEYEIYSFEAYRKKYQDDIRPIERATIQTFDANKLQAYLLDLKIGKPNLSSLPDEEVKSLMSIIVNGHPSLYANLLFGIYPQAFFPQLCITAVMIPGTEMGALSSDGKRFLDNKKLEGTVPQMLEAAINFVTQNTRQSTVINPSTGKREDIPEYPYIAVREAILNALVHRDYSIHTEGMPIRILLFSDRLEIHSPGGIYGKINISQLGKVQPDTRNPALTSALEVLKVTENRYSGIPTIKEACRSAGLPEPEFLDKRGTFIVIFRKKEEAPAAEPLTGSRKDLLAFCKTKRTRHEIAQYLGIKSVSYAVRKYINPLADEGKLILTIPDKPGSPNQLYYSL